MSSTSCSTASELAPGWAKISSGRPGAAVHEGGRAVIGGADLDAADVAQARHAALAVGLQDDVGELLGRGQPAERLHVELIGRFEATGGWFSTPAETWTFCARSAASTSLAFRL